MRGWGVMAWSGAQGRGREGAEDSMSTTRSLEGDRFYGHGVQNMKGGLASIIGSRRGLRTAAPSSPSRSEPPPGDSALGHRAHGDPAPRASCPTCAVPSSLPEDRFRAAAARAS